MRSVEHRVPPNVPRATVLFIWADNRIRTVDRVEHVFRPELETGNITPRDFETAKAFFAHSNHRLWPPVSAFAAGLGVTAYGKWRAKPAWAFGRLAGFSLLAGFIGSTFGRSLRAKALYDFTRSLEDREGFLRALENAAQQDETIRITSPQLEDKRPVPGLGERPDFNVDAVNPDRLPEAVPSESSASPSTQARTASRWDQLRGENARTAAQNSTWESLRQASGKAGLASNSQRSDEPGASERPALPDAGQTGTDGRLSQAEFDAMLEAERSIGKTAGDERVWR